jgi:hypothetical protein
MIVLKAVRQQKRIFSIWSGVTSDEVMSYSLMLAKSEALRWERGVDEVSNELVFRIKGLQVMANSQDILPSEKEKIQFRILDALYTISNGYKYAYIPFYSLYEELQAKDDREQGLIREGFENIRNARLVDSKALGTASITNEGIEEFENAILRPNERTTNFPSRISEILSKESRELRNHEIETIQSQRRAFLAKAYELSKGSSMQRISAFEIGNLLHYNQQTIERIYFYYQDKRIIKPFATGGKFTITHEGIEQAEKDQTS